jgi:hypothetical protein
MTGSGFALAKSRSPLAASTTSPLHEGDRGRPAEQLLEPAPTPASVAAILVGVFFTTVNVAFSPSDWRSSPSWATVRPRYSVSTAPDEAWNRSVSSATAATLSALAMGILLSVPERPARGQRAGGVGAVSGRRKQNARRRAHGA